MPWARKELLPLSIALNQVPGALNSWWLAFGWGNIIAPAWIYLVLDLSMLVGLAGAGYRLIANRDRRIERWGLLILLAWLVVIVVAFVRWIQLLDAALGRLLFPAISAAAILIVVGWYCVSATVGGAADHGHVGLVDRGAALVAHSGLCASCVVERSRFSATARPARSMCVTAMWRVWCASIGRVSRGRNPAMSSRLRLCWQPLKQDARPLMVLMQIVGAENRVVATRRTLPGLGSYPTSVWQPNAIFCDVSAPAAARRCACARCLSSRSGHDRCAHA